MSDDATRSFPTQEAKGPPASDQNNGKEGDKDQAEKRRMNAIHSRRKRERKRIEIEVLREQCASFSTRNMYLFQDNERLEKQIQEANDMVGLYQTDPNNPIFRVPQAAKNAPIGSHPLQVRSLDDILRYLDLLVHLHGDESLLNLSLDQLARYFAQQVRLREDALVLRLRQFCNLPSTPARLIAVDLAQKALQNPDSILLQPTVAANPSTVAGLPQSNSLQRSLLSERTDASRAMLLAAERGGMQHSQQRSYSHTVPSHGPGIGEGFWHAAGQDSAQISRQHEIAVLQQLLEQFDRTSGVGAAATTATEPQHNLTSFVAGQDALPLPTTASERELLQAILLQQQQQQQREELGWLQTQQHLQRQEQSLLQQQQQRQQLQLQQQQQLLQLSGLGLLLSRDPNNASLSVDPSLPSLFPSDVPSQDPNAHFFQRPSQR